MTITRKVFSFLLMATLLTSATLVTAPSADAYHPAKRARKEARHYTKDVAKANKQAVNHAAIANRKATKNYVKAVKRSGRWH